MVDYSADMTKIAEMVQGVTKGVVDLGVSIIAEEWENYDELLRTRKTIMPKLIYVYEGITNENGCNELLNKKHF